MDYKVQDMVAEYCAEHSQKRLWTKVIMALALVTVFCTVCALILPVVAMENTVYCGLEEHTHTVECYEEDVLVCPLEEHIHSENCLIDSTIEEPELKNEGLTLSSTDQEDEQKIETVEENVIGENEESNNLVEPLLMMLGEQFPVLTVNQDTESSTNFYVTKTNAYENGKHVITIEAHTDAETTKVKTLKENDIILLLDTSGSMEDSVQVADLKDFQKEGISSIDTILDKTKPNGYYYLTNVGIIGYTAPMRYNETRNTWQWRKQIGLLGIITEWEDYTTLPTFGESNICMDRIDALKVSVNSFIDYIYDNAVANNLDHKISLVVFNDDSDRYTKTINKQTSVKENRDTLKANVNKLEAGGATAADRGFSRVNEILKVIDNNVVKSVVMFTDGEPNHSNGFDIDVANYTISQAYTAKTKYDANVYTVGLLNSYRGSGSNVFNFLDYVSSNYPESQSMRDHGAKISDSDAKYFIDTSSQISMIYDFTEVAKMIIESSVSEAEEGIIVVKDIVSHYYNVEDIEVGYKAYNSSTNTFGEFNTLETSEYTLNTETDKDRNTIINVSGFDFGKYSCNKDSINGRKLVLKIYTTPKETVVFAEDDKVFSNEIGSGIYEKKSETDVEKFVKELPRPEALTYNFEVDYMCSGTNIGPEKYKGKLFNGTKLTVTQTNIEGYRPVSGSDLEKTITETETNVIFEYELIPEKVTIVYQVQGNGSLASDTNVQLLTETDEAGRLTTIGATAYPGNGQKFKGWYKSGSDVPETTATDFNPGKFESNVTYFAVFEPDVYKVTISNKIEGSDLTENKMHYEVVISTTDLPFVISETDIEFTSPTDANLTITPGENMTTISFYLLPDENAVISNVPNGATVSITESNYEGYIVKHKVNGISIISDDEVPGDNVLFTINDEDADVEFYNIAGYELPHTGGTGTDVYVISGITLIFLSVSLMVNKKRKRDII